MKKLILFVLMLTACGDPFAPTDVRQYIDVATGGDHTCAVAKDGAVYCWGRNTDGELGTGSTTSELTPAKVKSDVVFKSVTVGESHSCGLAVDGRVFCWGWNAFYQTGITAALNLKVPNPIESPERFTQISAGAHHTCGIVVDGRVFCWGYNRYGQNGNGGTQTTVPAEAVTGGLKAKQVSAGSYHTCAISAANTAYCWGRNDFGQLGIGSDVITATNPTAVQGALQFTQIDAGATHTCGIAGTIGYCWGSSEYGEIGDAAPFKQGLPGPRTPTPLALMNGIELIAAGESESCAVAAGGTTYCWGRGTEGQLGTGSDFNRALREPIYLQPDHPFRFDVLAPGGRTHMCALSTGLIYCWGTGRYGQLGAGMSIFSLLPQRIRE